MKKICCAEILIVIQSFLWFSCNNNRDKSDQVSFENAKTQIFRIDSRSDTLITCLQGTRILIPKKSFKSESGEVALVELTIEEYYDKSDMILRGLSTESDSNLLISSGMVYIDAKSNGKSLTLSTSSFVDIYFRRNKFDSILYLPFKGDVSSSVRINWRITDSVFLQGKVIRKIMTHPNNPYEETIMYTFDPDSSFFRSLGMGWINSDIFSEYGDKGTLVVKSASKNKPRVFITFIGLNSIIEGGVNSEGFYLFSNIPKVKNGYIIAYEKNFESMKYSILEINHIGDTINIELNDEGESNLLKSIAQLEKGDGKN